MPDEMPPLQPPRDNQGITPLSVDHDPHAPVPEPEVPPPLEDDRIADEFEAHSIKWNVARIVRLSSGRFALLTHYRAGALDIIKVGTIEEIVDHIPTPEQCVIEYKPRREAKDKSNLDELLADIGLI